VAVVFIATASISCVLRAVLLMPSPSLRCPASDFVDYSADVGREALKEDASCGNVVADTVGFPFEIVLKMAPTPRRRRTM
jgi:hypothetical protein